MGRNTGERRSSFHERHGAKVELIDIDTGYGFTDYVVTGSREAVSKIVEEELGRWPNGGYGTWFNWPPPPDGPKTHDGNPVQHRAPVEVEPGIWRAQGHRSNSCD